MKDNSLSKISSTSMKVINLEQGDVLHFLKNSAESFKGFGEVYFSKINAYSIKAWKLHKKMTLNLIVPIGTFKFVFYSHVSNTFRVEEIGESNYRRLYVPPRIWFGFKGISKGTSLVANLADIEHDPKEAIKKNLDEISYDWNLL